VFMREQTSTLCSACLCICASTQTGRCDLELAILCCCHKTPSQPWIVLHSCVCTVIKSKPLTVKLQTSTCHQILMTEAVFEH
jgi:hypothetical protein